ncbi:MAG: hypothetical protein HFG51_08590 [Lachnospiraceae bacterium]|nr:hypothetical protein [Lachnospiraceae bacterium]
MEIIRLLDYIDFFFYYSEYFSLLSNFILLYNTIYKGLIRLERFFLIFLSEYRFFPMIYGGKTLFSFVFLIFVKNLVTYRTTSAAAAKPKHGGIGIDPAVADELSISCKIKIVK